MCSTEFLHLDRKPWATPPPTAGVPSVVLRMAADNSGLEVVDEEVIVVVEEEQEEGQGQEEEEQEETN
jgi:hypothetical protein